LPRALSFDSPDRAVRPGISEVELQALGVTIFDPRRIESLLVLPPADGANEALVFDVDPLPASRDDKVLDAPILELETVELEIAGIGDQRILGLAVEAAEITLDEWYRGFGFAEQAEIAERDFRPSAGAKRDCVGVLGDGVLVDVLPPEAKVEERLDRESGGQSRRGDGCDQERDDQFLHV
jgi:hypothetical protein